MAALARRAMTRVNSRHGVGDADRLYQLRQSLELNGGYGHVERIGVELDRQPVGFLGDRARRARRRVERQTGAAADQVVADRDVRDAEVPDDQHVRASTQIEARIVDGRERAADEFQRDHPSAACARGWRGQRDETAGNGGERLVRGQDDRLPLVGDRQGARLFADGHDR